MCVDTTGYESNAINCTIHSMINGSSSSKRTEGGLINRLESKSKIKNQIRVNFIIIINSGLKIERYSIANANAI